MAIHRYWRLTAFAVRGGGPLELSEAKLYANGVPVDTSATLTCPFAPSSGSLADLRDGQAAGVVSWPHDVHSSAGFALVWDMGINGAAVSGVRLGSGDSPDTYPTDLILQWSNGAEWTTLQEFVGATYPGSGTLTVVPQGNGLADVNPDKVILDLRADGPDGSTVITDSSVPPKIVTATGGARLSTAQSASGGSSFYFGSSGAKLSTSASDSYFFGLNNFSVRCRLYPLSYGSGSSQIIGIHRYGRNCVWILILTADGHIMLYAFSGPVAITPAPVPLNQWTHVEVDRWGEAGAQFVAISINGVMGDPVVDNRNYADNRSYFPAYQADLTIGGDSSANSNSDYLGYIDDLDIALVERNSTSFIPPAAGSVPSVNLPVDATHAARLRMMVESLDQFAGAEMSAGVATTHAREQTFRDVYHGGLGRVWGTVKEKHAPDNAPVRRRVLLIDQRSRLTIRETWSDAETGVYEFRGVNEGVLYTVLSYDLPVGQRAVVADDQIPELML